MLITHRKKAFLRIRECYFSPPAPNSVGDSDIDICYQLPAPDLIRPATRFDTIHIDLSKSETELLADLAKNTRNEIQRALAKDELETKGPAAPTMREVDDFAAFFDRFASQIKLASCNRAKLRALMDVGGIAISSICRSDGGPLCFHVYVIDECRVRLLYSASHFRDHNNSAKSLIGRANRMLHWTDIQKFKSEGKLVYDLGGIGKNTIAAFKRGFGGCEVSEYNVLIPRSSVGRLAALYFKITTRGK